MGSAQEENQAIDVRYGQIDLDLMLDLLCLRFLVKTLEVKTMKILGNDEYFLNLRYSLKFQLGSQCFIKEKFYM